MHELNVISKPVAGSAVQVPDNFPLSYSATKSDTNVLTDGFGRMHNYLRISLVEHCNLRCSYCMPEEGFDSISGENLLSDVEIIRLARLFVDQGVTKIRLTGGEPLLRPGIEQIAEELGALPGLQTLAITTNALLLKRKLRRLKKAGLNLINISLDTLRPDRFKQITRRDGLDLVLEAMDHALESGFDPLKINCVVMRGVNEDEILDFVELTRDRKIEVRFIEFMPFDGNRWKEDQLVSFDEIFQKISQRYPIESLQSGPCETAKLFHVRGFDGQLGFITSMTDEFCQSCNRIRITADGHLKVCLFGPTEISLLNAMRNGVDNENLLELISAAIGGKHARHAGMHQIALSQNRPMITIGG